jgi:Resolvase, N terminal domain
MLSSMRAIGYARVSTDKQADHGVSLEAQEAKIRAMATVQGAAIIELIVDGGESAKDLKRPGMDRLLTLVDERKVDTVIIAKLDRLTRSVKDLAELLERFQRRGVSLVSVAESLDTGSAAGRLVINIMTAVSQWEREVGSVCMLLPTTATRSSGSAWSATRLKPVASVGRMFYELCVQLRATSSSLNYFAHKRIKIAPCRSAPVKRSRSPISWP